MSAMTAKSGCACTMLTGNLPLPKHHEREKPCNHPGLEESDAFVFDTDDKNNIPRRNFLFGPTSDKKRHNLALFTLFNYDREENLYATLRIDADGKKKTARLIWMGVE